MEMWPLDRARWPLLALLASGAMLAAAHAIENFLYLAPCPLCLRQREIYWVAGALALAAVAVNWRGAPPKLASALCLLLGAAFLAEAGVALYHSLVEFKILPAPSTCATAAAPKISSNLWDTLNHPVKVGSCDKVLWRFPTMEFGLSMAAWNVLISLALAAMSVLSALRPVRIDTANEREPVTSAT